VDFAHQSEIDGLIRIFKTKPKWLDTFGYWYTGVIFLSFFGFVLHVLAFLGLKLNNRDKQV